MKPSERIAEIRIKLKKGGLSLGSASILAIEEYLDEQAAKSNGEANGK